MVNASKGYSIFDFDFEPISFTEEEIQEAFTLLVQRVKEKGNYYSLNGIETADIKKYFQEFEDRKWVSNLGIRRDLLDYHTVDEVIETIEEYVDELLERIQNGEMINWRDDTWKTWNKLVPCTMAVDFQESQKKRMEVWQHTKSFSKKIALTLGLNHYMENPRSRGSLMNAYTSKGYNKHLIPYLEKEVAQINDFDEMERFFNCYFLAARADEIWKDSSIKTIPYPIYIHIPFNELEIAALCETDESNVREVLKLILKHVGCVYRGNGGMTDGRKDKTIRYTPTFSYQDYLKSLTDEDLLLIFEDIKRLNRLHGKE